jgi:hypothetical protein
VRPGSAVQVIRDKRAGHRKVVIRRDKLAGLDARLECIQVGAMPSTACSVEILDEIVARAQPLIVTAITVREEGRERHEFLLCSSTPRWGMQIHCIQSYSAKNKLESTILAVDRMPEFRHTPRGTGKQIQVVSSRIVIRQSLVPALAKLGVGNARGELEVQVLLLILQMTIGQTKRTQQRMKHTKQVR